jgi:hypothetical protein
LGRLGVVGNFLLLEEAQDGLGDLVGLGEHGGAGLDEDVGAGVLGGFLGDVDVFDAGAGGG